MENDNKSPEMIKKIKETTDYLTILFEENEKRKKEPKIGANTVSTDFFKNVGLN